MDDIKKLLFLFLFLISLQNLTADSVDDIFLKINIDLNDLDTNYQLSTWHKVLGYTAAGLGVSACFLNPYFVDEDIHEVLGQSAGILSGVTMGLGYLSHRNEVFVEDGSKASLFHAILGITGGVLMISAPIFEDNETIHKCVGITGASLMGISLTGVWFF